MCDKGACAPPSPRASSTRGGGKGGVRSSPSGRERLSRRARLSRSPLSSAKLSSSGPGPLSGHNTIAYIASFEKKFDLDAVPSDWRDSCRSED
jgi:hypothetical protein